MSETEIVLPSTTGNSTGQITLLPRSDESQSSLKTAALTSLQQLNKSGNLLIESMQKVMKSSEETKKVEYQDGTVAEEKKDFNVMEVVECAKALAVTAQTQSQLVKVLKDFMK